MNQIFVYAEIEKKQRVFIGLFEDINSIEEDVLNTLNRKGLDEESCRVFMMLGTEKYRLILD